MNLFSFQYHLLFRLLTFANRIINSQYGPQKLRNLIVNKNTGNYQTRRTTKEYTPIIPLNHYGEATCNFFLSKTYFFNL